MKPGYKTTEFYGVLASAVVTLLVLLNVIEAGDHEELAQAITNVFAGAAVAIANAAVVGSYIRSRTELKSQAQEEETVRVFAKGNSGNA